MFSTRTGPRGCTYREERPRVEGTSVIAASRTRRKTERRHCSSSFETTSPSLKATTYKRIYLSERTPTRDAVFVPSVKSRTEEVGELYFPSFPLPFPPLPSPPLPSPPPPSSSMWPHLSYGLVRSKREYYHNCSVVVLLADHTNGRAYATVLRPSVVCRRRRRRL